MRKWIVLFAGLMLIVASCSPKTPVEITPTISTATVTPKSTPTSTPTLVPNLPPHTTTSLEIVRNNKQYRVLLGYDKGEVMFRQTPQPEFDDFQQYDDILNIDMANLEWYGDFDNDGETEYFLTVYGRGAYLTLMVLVIDYDASKDEYRVFDGVSFRAPCFDDWKDIENDGIPEIIAKDIEFHYANGGGGADSVFSPIKIYRYDGQSFVGVTQEYPDLIEENAEHWLEAIENDAGGQGQFSSIYAAYLADMYMLGKRDEGIEVFIELCNSRFVPYIEEINSDYPLRCDEFLTTVQDALKETGYAD